MASEIDDEIVWLKGGVGLRSDLYREVSQKAREHKKCASLRRDDIIGDFHSEWMVADKSGHFQSLLYERWWGGGSEWTRTSRFQAINSSIRLMQPCLGLLLRIF